MVRLLRRCAGAVQSCLRRRPPLRPSRAVQLPTENLLPAGRDGNADVAIGFSPTLRASLPTLEAARQASRYRLAELQGQTPAEAADFWQAYDAHQAELTRIDVRRGEIRAELATATGDDAVDLAEDYRRLAIQEAELLERTFDRLARDLPAEKAIRYVQLESSLRALRHFEQDAADDYAGG